MGILISLLLYKVLYAPIKGVSERLSSVGEVMDNSQKIERQVASTPQSAAEEDQEPSSENIETKYQGLDAIKLKMITMIQGDIERDSKRGDKLYTYCVPQNKYLCEEQCVNEFGEVITCETIKEDMEIKTLCRVDNPDCVPESEWVTKDKIVSESRKTKDNEICVAKLYNCKDPQAAVLVDDSDLRTFLPPDLTKRYLEQVDDYYMSKKLVNRVDLVDLLNDFADCVLEGVPSNAQQKDLEKFVSENTYDSCFNQHLKGRADE